MGDKNLLMARKRPLPGETELTHAQKLIVKTWPVIVSRSQVLSPQFAELLGVPANDPRVENVAQHGAINTSLSAAKLAEIFSIGGTPFFRNPSDTVELYRDICDYLFEFKRRFENNHFPLDTTEKLMENVLKLENFAEWVFGIAQPYFPKEDLIPKNSLAGRIGNGRFTRDLFTKPSSQPKEVAPTARPTAAPVHGRITDTVLEQAFEMQHKQKIAKTSRGWS